MPGVSIRYENGTTVEANNLGDALVHLMHTGLDYVVDVTEQQGREHCKHCGGTGIAPEQPKPVVVLTRKQAEQKVAEVDEETPRLESTFDERVKVARRLAKA